MESWIVVVVEMVIEFLIEVVVEFLALYLRRTIDAKLSLNLGTRRKNSGRLMGMMWKSNVCLSTCVGSPAMRIWCTMEDCGDQDKLFADRLRWKVSNAGEDRRFCFSLGGGVDICADGRRVES